MYPFDCIWGDTSNEIELVSMVLEEMDLILRMELKVTIIMEESEEYYEQWVKEDKNEKKVWPRRII